MPNTETVSEKKLLSGGSDRVLKSFGGISLQRHGVTSNKGKCCLFINYRKPPCLLWEGIPRTFLALCHSLRIYDYYHQIKIIRILYFCFILGFTADSPLSGYKNTIHLLYFYSQTRYFISRFVF